MFRRTAAAVLSAFSLASLAIAPFAVAAPRAAAAGATGAAGAAPQKPAPAPKYPWPEAHGNPQVTGLSADPAISTANAANLGVRWMANLTSPALMSPVVGYNQALKQTLVYAGSEGGWFSAFNAASGATVWSVNLGSAIRMTPVIDGPYVWVASTYSPALFKLNASTGAQLCQTPIFAVAEASPIVVTPPGGSPTVFMGSNDTGASGPLYSINEANCVVNWAFTGYARVTGLWDFISYSLDKTGQPLVVFGTSDTDSEVYALNALTGTEVWRFQTANPPPNLADVGSGAAIAVPGSMVGGADGKAFVTSKDGNVYALDLTTGTQVWVYAFQSPPVLEGSRSTAALVGNQLVFGTSLGTVSVKATTGKPMWTSPLPKGSENLGAVAVVGPVGSQVVLTTSIDGKFRVLSLATGAVLYSYQTHNYLASSPADVDGNVLFAAADGTLYDFRVGGGDTAAPTTTATSPAAGSTVANPGSGGLVISGTASDPTGVNQVNVAVQTDGQSGPWWSATKHSWQPGPFNNAATLATKGATTTTWSLTVPMPTRGASIEVRASAVNTSNVADTSSNQAQSTPARVDFTVSPSATAPTVFLSAARAAPGTQVTITGGGYGPNEQVAIAITTNPVTTLATVSASSTGALPPTPVTLPTKVRLGPISVTTTGRTSGRSGSAPLIVSNNWDQFANTSSRTNFEPNDSALTNNVGASGLTYLDRAYNFPAGSQIHSSVAIDNGQAFFGNDAGDFFSINVATGAPIWQHSYTAGIDSSAAVDSGMVIFGTKADAVVAVSEATGAPIWSTTTTGGGVESSPAVSGGVVYVGSDNGNLYALNEQTGAVLWTYALGAAVHSSPVVDTAHATVVVGDDSGHVTAVSTGGAGHPAAGTVGWSASTGGPVVAAPLSISNKVYVGSGDGKEYAFDGGTGAVAWTSTTGGPITASNVAFGSEIAVGSQDQTVYYLDSATGALVNSLAGIGPIVGLAGAVNFVVITYSNGLAEGSRISGADDIWRYNGDGSGFASAPVTNNGSVYLTGLDGNLQVFTPPGRSVT